MSPGSVVCVDLLEAVCYSAALYYHAVIVQLKPSFVVTPFPDTHHFDTAEHVQHVCARFLGSF